MDIDQPGCLKIFKWWETAGRDRLVCSVISRTFKPCGRDWAGRLIGRSLFFIRLIFVHIVVFAPREGFVRQRFDDRQPHFIAQRDKRGIQV